MLQINEPKHVLITGVSSGIGFDVARHLLNKGYFVFGSIRKPNPEVTGLKKKFSHSFVPLTFDICDNAAIEKAARTVKDILGKAYLNALVNNAGLVVMGPIQLIDDTSFRNQMDVNFFGTRNVINAFLPHLGADPNYATRPPVCDHPRRIINISSLSGIINTPMNGAYCASKHAMESLGEVYRRELWPFGVDVVSIQPGPIQSKLWEKTEDVLTRFEGTAYQGMARKTRRIIDAAEKDALPAAVISNLIQKIIEAKRPKHAYIVHKNKIGATILAKYLPARVVDWLIRQKLK